MPVGFYERNRSGVLISRMTNDVQALDSLVTDTIITLFQASLTLLGTIGILLLLDVKLALLTFCIFPVMALGSLDLPDRLGGRLPAHARDDRRDHGLPAGDAVGIRVVRSFGQEPATCGVRRAQRANRDANMTTVNLNAAYFPAVELLSALATVGIRSSAATRCSTAR